MRPPAGGPNVLIILLDDVGFGASSAFGGPLFESTPIGSFHHWPTGSGFEHFYGFIGGENNQYYPALYDGTTPVEPERTPEEGYHLMADLADKIPLQLPRPEAIRRDVEGQAAGRPSPGADGIRL